MKKVWVALIGLAMLVMPMEASSVATAPPASASVSACASLVVCINVDTGGKNYSNHTQWVGYVQVYTGFGAAFLETWGDGFYQTWNGANQHTWWIGRWVRSGTYVCGAGTRAGVPRRIACIAIRV